MCCREISATVATIAVLLEHFRGEVQQSCTNCCMNDDSFWEVPTMRLPNRLIIDGVALAGWKICSG